MLELARKFLVHSYNAIKMKLEKIAAQTLRESQMRILPNQPVQVQYIQIVQEIIAVPSTEDVQTVMDFVTGMSSS